MGDQGRLSRRNVLLEDPGEEIVDPLEAFGELHAYQKCRSGTE